MRSLAFLSPSTRAFLRSFKQPGALCGYAQDYRLEREADEQARQARHAPFAPAPAMGSPHTPSPAITACRTGVLASAGLTEAGKPLDNATQRRLAPLFGADLSRIRIHDSAQGNKSAALLRARAYASGDHIVFAAHQYRPGFSEGDRLIEHELTHVMQQRAGETRAIQRQPLPRQEVESVDYTLRRWISELNDHRSQGRIEDAQALVPRIRNYIEIEPLAALHADDAAEAFFRLGLVREGVETLESGREAQIGGYQRYSFSVQAVNVLFEAGDRYAQNNEFEQAFQAYRSLFAWLENSELSQSPFSSSEGPTATVRRFFSRVVSALFVLPGRMRAAGDQNGANRMYTRIRDLIVQSDATHRYGIDTARVLVDAGRMENAFAVLREAERDYPETNPLIAYSEQAVMTLVGFGEQAVSRGQWDAAERMFAEALQWVNNHADVLADGFYNLGNERRITAQAIHRIVRGIGAIVAHFRREATAGFQRNSPDARQRLETMRTRISALRNRFQRSITQPAIIALIEESASGDNTAVYRDAFGAGRELEVETYGGQGDFQDRRASADYVFETFTRQAHVLEQFYVADAAVVAEFERRHNRRPDIHALEDRRVFWEIKYDRLVNGGASRQEALARLIADISEYLQANAFHTRHNIPDTFSHPLTADFPETSLGQALMDCGIFAMRTAYELSLIRNVARVDFYFVSVPHHVYLGVIDRDEGFGWTFSNNQAREIQSDIAARGVGTAVAAEFNLIPSDIRPRQVTAATETGLRSRFRRSGGGLFLPENYRQLSSAARRQAEARARQLSNTYTRLSESIAEQTSRLRSMLSALGSAFSAREDGSSRHFSESAERRILELYEPYRELADQTADYIDTLIEAFGINRVRTMPLNLALYFFNMDLALRYVVYALGRSDLENDAHIQQPLYERIEQVFGFRYRGIQRDYRGTPPPWQAARWVQE